MILSTFYKTKYLAQNGRFILCALVVLLVLGPILIPDFKRPEPKDQALTLNGLHTKYNDHTAVEYFLNSIKLNDGYLCLGTSESTSLPNGNYYNFLNNDSTLGGKRFSILAGAGRTCSLYIPLFLQHKEAVKGLQLIFFINPVYWREDLCKVDKAYWNRYSNYYMSTNVSLSEKENSVYYPPVDAYLSMVKTHEKWLFSAEYGIRQLRKNYFQDLSYMLDPTAFENEFTYISKKRDLNQFNYFGEIDFNDRDTTWNIQKSFLHKEWFKPINTAVDYRFEELEAFFKMCKDLGIEATFIIGPYNKRFIDHYQPESTENYQLLCEGLKDLLSLHQVDHVDASDISNTAGAFNDHQHHSSYGAYLIYKKLKQHLNEKKH